MRSSTHTSQTEIRVKIGEIVDKNLVGYRHYSVEDHIPGFAPAMIIIEHNYLRDKDPDYESCIGEAIGEYTADLSTTIHLSQAERWSQCP